MRKKNVINIEFFIENQRWEAKGPRIHVENAPTLQATRRRARKAAIELYGPDVEIRATLNIPAALQERIAQNKQRRAEIREARMTLRADTVDIIEHLRADLGASYEDAAELLGVDASVLMRTVHSTSRVNLSDFDTE